VERDDPAGAEREHEQRGFGAPQRPGEQRGQRDRERRGERGPRLKPHRGAAIR
jgi:hypothetical protein